MNDEYATTPTGALSALDELVPAHLRTGKQTFARDRYERIKWLIERVADYEDVLANHRALVRELDHLLNGEAAKQASLCDIISQVRARREIAIEFAERLNSLGVTRNDWSKNAMHYFRHSGGAVPLAEVDDFFRKAVNIAERTATFLLHGVNK